MNPIRKINITKYMAFAVLAVVLIIAFAMSVVANEVTTTSAMPCYDTDNGHNVYTKGTIRWSEDGKTKSTEDFCWADTGKLGEWSCNEDRDPILRTVSCEEEG